MSRAGFVCMALGVLGAGVAWSSAPSGTGLAKDATAIATSAGSSGSDAANVPAGRTLFSQNCARCHGFNMMNPAPGVFDLRIFPADDKARFVNAVSAGKGAMPAWKDVLSAAEIDALWSYVGAARAP